MFERFLVNIDNRIHKAMLVVASVVAALFLASCSTAPTAPAAYYYRNGDCEIGINSVRDMTGASVRITPECAVDITTEMVPAAANQQQANEIIKGLLERLPLP